MHKCTSKSAIHISVHLSKCIDVPLCIRTLKKKKMIYLYMLQRTGTYILMYDTVLLDELLQCLLMVSLIPMM